MVSGGGPIGLSGGWGGRIVLAPSPMESRYRASLLAFLPSLAIIVACAWTVRPVGGSGRPLAVLLLLIANCLLLGARHLPDRWAPMPVRVGLLLAGIAASAGLNSVATRGAGSAFAFFVSGHAGYRLRYRAAVAVAVADSVANGGVLLLHLGPGHSFTPWYIGAASGVSVLLGMTNRSREQTLQSTVAAAEAGERAAQAEARETVLAERGRVARDVHDVLAHSLAGIGMQLEAVDALLEQGDVTGARAASQRARSLVRESLIEAQRTVRALREDALPLVDTIAAMLDSAGGARRPRSGRSEIHTRRRRL